MGQEAKDEEVSCDAAVVDDVRLAFSSTIKFEVLMIAARVRLFPKGCPATGKR